MRITFGMITGKVTDNLMASSRRLLEAQDTASSGKRIHRPSDDVTGTGKAMRLRSALSSIEQFERNAKAARAELTVTSSTLDSIVRNLQGIRGLTVTAANSHADKVAILADLDGAAKQLVSLANSQYADRYIFSGSQSGNQPIIPDVSGTAPYVYQGDNAQFMIQVNAGVHTTANVTADVIFNMAGTAVATAPDVFSMIQQLREDIEAGDVEAVSAHLDEIDANLKNVIAVRTQVGARLQRLESAEDTLADSKLAFSDLLSETEDVDITKAILELRTRENVYQAAIETAGRLLDLSLTDYLR